MFLLHKMPLAKRGLVQDVSIAEINSENFDFRGHFSKDVIAQRGRWWVCKKSKPWSIHDVMVVDSSDNFARSFGDLAKRDLQELFDLIYLMADYLRNNRMDKVVIGANINQFLHSCDPESIQRLHVHLCGFGEEEIASMERIKKDELSEKSGRSANIFDDDLVESFKRYFKKEDHKFEYNYCDFDYGYCFDLGNSLGELKTEGFTTFIHNLDNYIKNIFEEIRSQNVLSDRFLSYAFTITYELGELKFYMSPRSVSGRGVLESLGIILARDLAKDLALEQYDLRDRFFHKLTLILQKENK